MDRATQKIIENPPKIIRLGSLYAILTVGDKILEK